MNKSEFYQELYSKTGLDNEKNTKISNIIENTLFLGKNNREEIIGEFKEKAGLSYEEADNVYNIVTEIVAENVKDKITKIFRRNQ